MGISRDNEAADEAAGAPELEIEKRIASYVESLHPEIQPVQAEAAAQSILEMIKSSFRLSARP